MTELPFPTDPSRWFQPRRTDLEKARAAIRSPGDFASFAAGWASNRRRFMVHGEVVTCGRCDGAGETINFDPVTCVPCHGNGQRRAITLADAPGTLDDCLAVAADLPGIAKAEELLLEAMRRLGSWHVPQWERQIVWVSLPESLGDVPRDDLPGTQSPYVMVFGEYLLAQCGFRSSPGTERFAAGKLVGAHENAATKAASGHLSGVHHALETILATALWAKNVKAAAKKPLQYGEPDPATLEDPFEPLGALLDLGYALGGWNEKYIEMWMPSLALVA